MTDEIIVKGINSKGYGTIPKLLMTDKTIDIKAKAIYGYLSSFAGAGKSAFPSREKMTSELGIGKDTLSKNLNVLKKHGYISISQEKENGKFRKNIYYLNSEISVSEKTVSEKTVSEKTVHGHRVANNNIILLNNNNSNNNNTLESKDSSIFKVCKNKKENNYKEVFDYYLTLNLIKHKRYTVSMSEAMEKAKKRLGITIQEMKDMLKRHAERVENTKNNGKYAKRIRPLAQFFGTKKSKDSPELICEEYLEENYNNTNYNNKAVQTESVANSTLELMEKRGLI